MTSNNRRRLPLTWSKKLQSTKNIVCPELLKLKQKQDKVAQHMAQDAAFSELLKLRAANGGKSNYGDMKGIIDRYKENGFLITRSQLEYRVNLRKKGISVVYDPVPPMISITENNNNNETVSNLTKSTENSNTTELTRSSNSNNDVSTSIGTGDKVVRKGGRSKGSTNKSKTEKTNNQKKAVSEAATLCIEARKIAKENQKRLTNGTFNNIIKDTEEKYSLDVGSLCFETIKSRVQANNASGQQPQKITPLWQVESMIVDVLCRLSKMGESMTKSEVMDLADSLIIDTVHADRLIEFCLKRNIHKNISSNKLVGDRWYSNFLNRHSDELRCGRCKIQDTNRQTWCTKENFMNMYSCVYESMVEAGVAVKLDEEVMMDREGNETLDPSQQFGRKTQYKLTRPDRCIYVDETGCNTNMKDDGNVGGRLYVMAANQLEGARTGCTSDIHFTVLAFTNGYGVAIMCAVVMKSEKGISEIPLSWRLGIDVSKDVISGETLVEIFDNNLKSGVSTGGPTCTYNGINLPCFVCTSPNASITSELLVEMLAAIDNTGMFPRNDELGMPFLLIDGHHSRTRLPFLKYVNDDQHRWKVCIGVPYATHMWQPHDSSELNGTFKIKLYKTKQEYLRQKPPSFKTYTSTDIIPILNKIWPTTLGNSRYAQKAIKERGWFVLNYILADDPRLFCTKNTNHVKSTNTMNCDAGSVCINENGLLWQSTLDKMIEDRAKSDGRKRKYEEMHRLNAIKETNIQKLEKMMSISSGKLASNNMFCLDDSIRDKMIIDDNKKKKEMKEKLERKDQQSIKQQATFRQAAIKHFGNITLNVGEIKSLLKHVANKFDSPLAPRVTELRAQLHRRQHRLQMYNLFPTPSIANVSSNNDNNNNGNDAVLSVLHHNDSINAGGTISTGTNLQRHRSGFEINNLFLSPTPSIENDNDNNNNGNDAVLSVLHHNKSSTTISSTNHRRHRLEMNLFQSPSINNVSIDNVSINNNNNNNGRDAVLSVLHHNNNSTAGSSTGTNYGIIAATTTTSSSDTISSVDVTQKEHASGNSDSDIFFL
jgi:hypothetical protein